MCKDVVIIGAGGNSIVIADIIEKSKDNVYGFLDDDSEVKIYEKYRYLGKIENCLKLQEENQNLYFIIAIGNNHIRQEISNKYDLNYYTAIHPTASIGFDATIGEGCIIQANCCIDPLVKIGKNSIIGKGAIVAHNNIIGDYVHVSPNATLCGTVQIGNFTHIGAGATVRNNISIIDNCIIGMGAVVVKNIEEQGTYAGVPAKKIK